MKEKKNEGITLIALVITIIVLLILAGVTLSTLFGNNGILTESQLAVEANKEANAKEQVQLAWMGCETEYQSAWTQDSSVVKKDYFDPDDLNRNLGTGTVKSVNYAESGNSKVTYTLEGTEYEFEIANGQVYKVGEAPDVTQPEVTSGNLAKIIKPASYGDYINYNVDLDNNPSTNDWRIFYNDGDNVFLIASEPLPKNKIPSIETMEIDEEYNEVYWNDNVKGNSGASGIDKTVAEKFGLNWIKNYPSSTNTNIKCVQDLMNTSYWSDFAKGIEGAKAIGGPTLEMWINSWNQQNPDLKLIYNDGGRTNSDGSVYEEYVGENPYSPDEDEYDWWEKCALDSAFGYQFASEKRKEFTDARNLSDYFSGSHSVGVNLMADGYYWIASPSASNWDGNDGFLFEVGTWNSWPTLYTREGTYNASGACLRPVVCLPTSVNATKLGTTWMIEP